MTRLLLLYLTTSTSAFWLVPRDDSPCPSLGIQCSMDRKTVVYCSSKGGIPTPIRACPANTFCSNSTGTPQCDASTCAGTKPLCTVAGAIPSPTSCKIHYICVAVGDTDPAQITCPENQVYDTEKFECSSTLPCRDPVQCQKPGDNGIVDPGPNTFFYYCTDDNSPFLFPNTGDTTALSTNLEDATTRDESTTEDPNTTDASTTSEESTAPEESTTSEEPITTDGPTTTDKSTTSEEPTTTDGSTTSAEPTTTEEPTSSEEPTTTEGSTTSEEPTTTEGPSTTSEAPTTTEEPTTPGEFCDQLPICTIVGVKYADSTDCKGYCLCTAIGSSPVSRKCPEKYIYDNVRKTCVLGVCQDPTPTTSSPTTSTSTPGNSACASLDPCTLVGVKYPDEVNCHNYCLCTEVGKAPASRSCPPNYIYDRVRKTCILGVCGQSEISWMDWIKYLVPRM